MLLKAIKSLFTFPCQAYLNITNATGKNHSFSHSSNGN